MELLTAIKTRRSVRKFKSEVPDQALVDQVIEAGVWAPSGHNRQPAVIIQVTDRALIERLTHTNSDVLGLGREVDTFYSAPCVLIVLARRDTPTCVYDGTLVMGNMMLMAHAVGLGGCWIHRARQTFDRPEWREWLASLGLFEGYEGEYEGIGQLALGYPAEPLGEPRERTVRVVKV